MFTLTQFLSLPKIYTLHWVLVDIILLTLAICSIGFLKGGAWGISVVAVDLAYPVAGSIVLALANARFGKVPPMIVSPIFWGWVLTTFICFVWALVMWLL